MALLEAQSDPNLKRMRTTYRSGEFAVWITVDLTTYEVVEVELQTLNDTVEYEAASKAVGKDDQTVRVKGGTSKLDLKGKGLFHGRGRGRDPGNFRGVAVTRLSAVAEKNAAKRE